MRSHGSPTRRDIGTSRRLPSILDHGNARFPALRRKPVEPVDDLQSVGTAAVLQVDVDERRAAGNDSEIDYLSIPP